MTTDISRRSLLRACAAGALVAAVPAVAPTVVRASVPNTRPLLDFPKWLRIVYAVRNDVREQNILKDWIGSREFQLALGYSASPMTGVNATVNKLPYRHDPHNTWLTPWQFLWLTQKGDCEDFSVAKYWLLRRLGVEVDSLRILIGHDYAANAGHVVLHVGPLDKGLILDNRINALIPADRFLQRFAVQRSCDEHYVYDHDPTGKPTLADVKRRHNRRSL